MCKRWLMLLFTAFFAVGMVLSSNFEYVFAADFFEQTEEVTTEAATFSGSDDSSLSDNEIQYDNESFSVENEELSDESGDDKVSSAADKESESKASSSGTSTVIVQESDDSAIRALINEYVKGRDTLNGFQKQVLDRLNVLSICSILTCALLVCGIFILR